MLKSNDIELYSRHKNNDICVLILLEISEMGHYGSDVKGQQDHKLFRITLLILGEHRVADKT